MTPTLSQVYGQRTAKNPHGRNWFPTFPLPKHLGNRATRRVLASKIRKQA